MEQTIEILWHNDDTFAVIKDDEELIAFGRDENLGGIYYSIISLLKKLGIQIEER